MKEYFKDNWKEIVASITISCLFWGSFFKFPYRYLFGDFDLAITYFYTAKLSLLNYHEFPFFSSYIGGGFPVWANPQNMLFSIPQVFSLLINNQWLAIRISIVALSVISMLGMFSFFKQLDINSFWCRLFGTIVYTFSGYLVSHFVAGHFTFQNLVYVPWLASAFLWSYKYDKFSYAIPVLLAIMVYAGLNVTSMFIIIITLSFLTFTRVKRLIVYILFGILLSLPKLIASYQLLSWFPRNLTMGYVSKSWYGTLHTLITALIWPQQSWFNNLYKYVSAEIHAINGYVGILVLILAIVSIVRIRKHKFPKLSYSMLIVFGIALFIYPGKLNPAWSLLSKNLILGSLHMPSWFIGLFVFPFAYFSTIELYNFRNFLKKKTNLIFVIICIFIFWDYYRISRPNLDYAQYTFTLSNKAHFDKDNVFEHDKGSEWRIVYQDKICFESDVMSDYVQDNRGVLQFYDSILGYDEFGFLRHSKVKSGKVDFFNKNPDVKIEWISPSKISVEVIKSNKGQLEIPVNLNYFPGWKVAKKIPGVSLNKSWSPEKWGLLTVFLDEDFPTGVKKNILLEYVPGWNLKSYKKEEIPVEPAPVTALDWFQRGEKLYEACDFENAVIAFDNAIKINANFVTAWEEKGWALAKLRKHTEMVACFEKASSIRSSDNVKKTAAIIKDSKDYFIRAHFFLYENRYNNAIDDFNTAIKLAPGYVKAYCYRGIACSLSQDFLKAITDFNKVIEFGPDNAGVYFKRGDVYSQMKNYQNALSDLTKCIQLSPIYAEVYNNLGILLSNLGRDGEAEKMFRKAIEIKPYYLNSYYNLGSFYVNLKKFNEAEKMYKRAAKMRPNDETPHYILANLFLMLKRYDDAEKEFKESIRIKPNYPQAHNNLSVLYYNLKRFEEAERECIETLRIDPYYPEAHYNLGIVYFNLKRYNEAEREYKEAIRIRPNYLQAHKNLAVLLYSLKRYEEAEAEYKMAK